MPIDQSLVGRAFPPTRPYQVSEEKVREFVTATSGPEAGRAYAGGPAPATFPIVLAFEAMNDFLAAEQVDLFRIVHGDQKFRYTRPIVPGDVLTATLTVATLRQIGGNDILGTTSVVADENGSVVCETSATLVHRGGE